MDAIADEFSQHFSDSDMQGKENHMAVPEPGHGYDILFACTVFLNSVIRQAQNWTILDLCGSFLLFPVGRSCEVSSTCTWLVLPVVGTCTAR